MYATLLLLVACCGGETSHDEMHHFVPIYGNRPGHPWDAVQETFFVRRFTTGETYYHRLSFNTPWIGFYQFVQREDIYKTTIDRLDTVANLRREEMEDSDPARRLLFFRDLWTVFESINKTVHQEEKVQARRDEIRRQLARIMRRLELSESEIAALPNTLRLLRSQAVFADSFDPQAPNQPFVPASLLDDGSEWVTSKISKELAIGATHHGQSVNQRSLFTIHILTTSGRQAGEEILAKANKTGGSVEFPRQTVLVLLRRALAGSKEGKLVVTNVVESLQIIVTPPGNELSDYRYKFVLDRGSFVRGKPGLQLLSDKTAVDAFSFESTGQWPHQLKKDDDGELLVLGTAKGPTGIPSMGHCVACHGLKTHQLYANTGFSGSFPSTNRELAQQIETTKAESDEWLEYLRLRTLP
jgi:hypothetical protein